MDKEKENKALPASQYRIRKLKRELSCLNEQLNNQIWFVGGIYASIEFMVNERMEFEEWFDEFDDMLPDHPLYDLFHKENDRIEELKAEIELIENKLKSLK